MTNIRIVDLSMPIGPHSRWFAHVMLKEDRDRGDMFRHSFMTLNMHGFTHIDAMNHILPDGLDASEAPLDRYCGPAAVVNLSHLGPSEPVTADGLEEHGRHIREGDIVLLRTDWTQKRDWRSDSSFFKDSPYMERGACEWLIEKKVKSVAYDFMSDYCIRYQITDPERVSTLTMEDFTTHDTFFPADIAVIEYVTNLHQIPDERCWFVGLPLPVKDSDGSPVRAVALLGMPV
jgi:kynurenine formamidase